MPVFTQISDTRLDVNSPLDEDLLQDWRDNFLHNYQHAVRGGAGGTGVRLACARGAYAFSDTTDGSGNLSTSYALTFSVEADDGNPNFDSPPIVLYALEEDNSGSNQDWSKFSDASGDQLLVYHPSGTSSTIFAFGLEFIGGDVSTDVAGILHWIAIGPVTSGE